MTSNIERFQQSINGSYDRNGFPIDIVETPEQVAFVEARYVMAMQELLLLPDGEIEQRIIEPLEETNS